MVMLDVTPISIDVVEVMSAGRKMTGRQVISKIGSMWRAAFLLHISKVPGLRNLQSEHFLDTPRAKKHASRGIFVPLGM